jgi:pseudouridylate synthase
VDAHDARDRALRLSPEVEAARRTGVPVVALESTIIAHGLPRPRNLDVASELEAIVRDEGACPATIAVLDGVARIGLEHDELVRVAEDRAIRKLGQRDLPVAQALGASGATTVSATAWLASVAGVRVFATGGLGGVHRGFAESFDESADLSVLSSTRITVVSAGVKSILDVPATLERLETLSVTVVGFSTSTFPGFYLHSSGQPLDWTVSTPAEVADIMRRQDALGLRTALLVANPVPEREQLDPELHDQALADALAAAERDDVRGQRLTPYLLSSLVQATEGAALEANLAAARGNVRLGAQIAVAFNSPG